MIEGKALLGPQNITIHPTNACQLNCTACWHYSPYITSAKPLEWRKSHLSYEQFKLMMKDFVELKVQNLCFSGGGDPLAHPQIAEFIELARDNNLPVSMLSNLLLAKDPERLAKAGLKYVIANCSAGDPETYKAYHPNQNEKSFFEFKEKIKILIKGGVKIELNCVLCKVNFSNIPQMLEFAAETSKLMSFKNMHIRESEGSGLENLLLNEKEINELKLKLPEYINQAKSLGVETNLSSFLHFLNDGYKGEHNFPIETVNCYAPYYTSMIRANGDVVVCCHVPMDQSQSTKEELIIGNINHESFKEIWFNKKYEGFREKLKNRKYFDFCKYCEYFAHFKSNQHYTQIIEHASSTNLESLLKKE
jgi:radical SAM protein with 4Fe4S-binding SPASM domain